MFIARDCYCFIVLWIIPVAVVISVWIGVGGFLCPRSCRAIRNFTVSYALRKSLPNLASDAEDATAMTLQSVCIAPLRNIGLPHFILLPRGKWPLAVLRAFVSFM